MRHHHPITHLVSNLRAFALTGSAVLALLTSACANSTTVPPTQTKSQPTPTRKLAATVSPTRFSTPRPTLTLPPTDIPPPSLTPFGASPQALRVEFKASDGQPLAGYFYPSWQPNAPVVVLMHQRLGNQAMWAESTIIPWLQNWPVDPSVAATPTLSANGMFPPMPGRRSFAVFTFDFRGHGESLPLLSAETEQDGSSYSFLLDANAAYQTTRQMPGVDPNRVIGIGTSIGADAVVDACAEGCIGAFSISPGNWLGVDYGQAVGNLLSQGKVVRCMYATNDGPSPATCWGIAPGESYKIFSYLGIKHGMTFFVPRKMEPDFGGNILEFLQAALREK